MISTRQLKISTTYPILVISLCALFLFYKYVLQIYPSVITNQLMQEFNLTGAGLGYLAGMFYYAYMVTQLLVGVLLDRFGTRWLTGVAIFSCAIGVMIFSQSQSLFSAVLSRGLMGAGVAFATVAYMKVGANWFPARQFAFITGLCASAAMAGAVFGQAPLALIVNAIGWRESLYMIGIVGMVLALFFVLAVREHPPAMLTSDASKQESKVSFKDILAVLKNKQNWLLTLYSGLAFSPIAIFGGLWGNPFIEQAYHLSRAHAATMVSLVFIGLGLGGPILGMVSDRLGERRNFMIACTLVGCVAISLVLFCHPMPTWLLGVFLFTFGFALGAFVLVFAIGKELNSAALTATVISMINASDAILDGVTEPAIGKLLDLTWDGTVVNGAHYFSLSSYHIGLGVLPIFLLLASVILLGVKKQ